MFLVINHTVWVKRVSTSPRTTTISRCSRLVSCRHLCKLQFYSTLGWGWVLILGTIMIPLLIIKKNWFLLFFIFFVTILEQLHFQLPPPISYQCNTLHQIFACSDGSEPSKFLDQRFPNFLSCTSWFCWYTPDAQTIKSAVFIASFKTKLNKIILTQNKMCNNGPAEISHQKR